MTELCAGNEFGPTADSVSDTVVAASRQLTDDGEVGHVRDKSAVVGLGTARLLPVLRERLAVLADNLERREELLDLVACREHDGVNLALFAGGRHNLVLLEAFDALREELDVGLVEAFEIAGIKHAALAAERE